MAAVDINRGSDGVVELPPEVSREIWSEVQRQSVIQQLCRRIVVPGSGLTIPIITGDPKAEWVSETEEKPVSRSTFGTKILKPYMLAVIEPFSKQFVRDLAALYNECRSRLPLALAKKFDRTCLGFEDSPGSGFDTLEDAPDQSLDGDAYSAALTALSTVVNAADGADITAWALSGQGEVAVLNARNDIGNPLFISNPATDGSVGQVLGRPLYKNSNVYDSDEDVVGFAGDWQSAVWGYVEGISIDISDQATLTDTGGATINLWQRNMVALRAEFEIGFAVRDENRFVKLTSSGTVGRTGRRGGAKKTAEPAP